MEYNKDYIGRILLGITSKELDFIIVGYDGIREVYLAMPMHSLNKDYHRFYKNIETAIPYEQVVNDFNEKIEYFEEVEEIISKKRKDIYYSHDDLDLEKIFRRIKECYANIGHNEMCLKGCSRSTYAETYKKEINNSQKGLRRALKRLYSVFTEDEYYIIMEYLEENKYDIDYLDFKISRLKERKKKFITDYKETIDYLKKTNV